MNSFFDWFLKKHRNSFFFEHLGDRHISYLSNEFTGTQRIVSQIFTELTLTAEQVLAG
ncbi:MAG: hypothetical protein U7127_12700 [Phormidium sp.]